MEYKKQDKQQRESVNIRLYNTKRIILENIKIIARRADTLANDMVWS